MAPSRHLNQCWLIFSKVQWHPLEGNCTKIAQPLNIEIILKINNLKFHSNFPGDNGLRTSGKIIPLLRHFFLHGFYRLLQIILFYLWWETTLYLRPPGWGCHFENSTVSKNLKTGGRLNIKMLSYQYRDSHVKDKTVSPTVLSLTRKSPYLGKTVFILRRGPGLLTLLVLKSEYSSRTGPIPWQLMWTTWLIIWSSAVGINYVE